MILSDTRGADRVFCDQWRRNARLREVGETTFAAADHGSWSLLTSAQVEELNSVSLSCGLHNELEQNGLITTVRNASDIAAQYQEWCSNYFVGTSLHIIGITRRCNLRCKYCHVSVVSEGSDLSKFDMSSEVGRAVVDFAFQSPARRIRLEFQGGEASLNFETVKAIYDYARTKNIGHKKLLSFSLVSNLADLTDVQIEFLARSAISVTTTLELSGSEEESCRVDWMGEETRTRVAETRRRLHARGISTPFLMVVVRSNLHRMRAYIDEAVRTGQQDIFLSPVQRLGFAKHSWNTVGIEIEDFFIHWRNAMEYIFSLWDKGVLIEERLFTIALEKLFGSRDVRYMDFRNPNGIGFGNMAYDHRGNVYGCDEGREHNEFLLGNVKTHTYDEVISSSRTHKLASYSLRHHPICQLCAYKPFCGVSPIVSKGERGNLNCQPLVDSNCKRTLLLFDYMVELLCMRPDRIRQALMIHMLKHNDED